jgi:acetoin utilization deacetylase AcuC-like enzyme
MGFCLFNGVAIAARRLQQEYPEERVAIVDYDVHHGNGSQWSFYDDPSVLYLSMHQYPLFPGTGRVTETGKGPGNGFTVNLPMAGGKTDDAYLEAFDALAIPIIREFSPGTVIVSAGFDAHAADPLAGMALSSSAYLAFTRRLLALAEEVCHGRLLHVLEGGYNLEALAESARLVLSALSGDEAPASAESAPEGTFRELEEAVAVQRQFWSSL